MQQHVVERKGFEATCCKEEAAETGRPGPLSCDDEGHIESSIKLYNYIKRCGGKLDPGWRSVCRRSPGTSHYYSCYPPQGFKPAHGTCHVYRSFPDVARAIGVQPIRGRREGQCQKRRRPAASTLAPHKRQKRQLPPQSSDASARVSVTPDDCLPPEEVANYPGKSPGKKDNPGEPDNPGSPRKKGVKFMSLTALAVDAPAKGAGHEPRDHRRVRGSHLLVEYPDESSSDAEQSKTDNEESGGQQGSQREGDLLDITKEQGTRAESDVLCEGALAKLLEDVKLQAGGSDIFESQDATEQRVDSSEARGGGSAALQQTIDEQLDIPAGNREQMTIPPQRPDQTASAGKGDGFVSCSQGGWPPVVKTPVPKAAAGMLPGGDPEKATHNGKAEHESHNDAEVVQGSEPDGADQKNSNTDSDSMSDEGLEGVLAFLLQANGSLLADESPARPDSALAAHIAEMQTSNHVLRFELAERSRLLAETSSQLAAKNKQLAEKERQLAVTSQQLAKKTQEYTALAAGVEEAIRGASAMRNKLMP